VSCTCSRVRPVHTPWPRRRWARSSARPSSVAEVAQAGGSSSANPSCTSGVTSSSPITWVGGDRPWAMLRTSPTSRSARTGCAKCSRPRPRRPTARSSCRSMPARESAMRGSSIRCCTRSRCCDSKRAGGRTSASTTTSRRSAPNPSRRSCSRWPCSGPTRSSEIAQPCAASSGSVTTGARKSTAAIARYPSAQPSRSGCCQGANTSSTVSPTVQR
jgi:hypothetical protein